MSFSNVHFILFKPQLAENIGACARALKNFNFTKLKLVSPKISFPNEKVYATSVGARDIIKSSKIYKNFEDAIKDVDCVIATSSRIRKKNYKYLSLSELKKIDFKKKIAILFGPEASGLTNNELSYVSSLKTSLNLSGYNLKKIDDTILINLSSYLVNQNNEDNKTTPRVLPFVEYNSGNYTIDEVKTNHKLNLYNNN